MITIQTAQVYSMNGAMAYQIEYSNGTSVRAVESRGQIIRTEHKTSNGWKQVGRAYTVGHSKNRNGERIKSAAVAFCL